MPISQRRYVDIASAVVGAGGAAMQKLDGRVFTDSAKLYSQQILEFSDAAGVTAHFGVGSDEAKFANAYFALTTPAPVSRARALQFAAHLTASRDEIWYGSTAHDELTALNLLTSATVSFMQGETLITDTLNFSGAASFGDVASTISGGSNITGANIVVTYADGRFVAKSPDGSQFTVVDNSDMQALGLYGVGAEYDEGGAQQTMLDAWTAAEQRNPSYGSAFFLERDALAECVEVAEANAALNVVHQVYFQATKAEASAFFAALSGTASCGLILETPSEPYVAHIPMALMSATDYNRANGTMNYMFRAPGVTVQPQITSDLDANAMDALRVNYYGQTAVAGQPIQFFQRAFLCGDASAPLDMSVHANEQWLKARFTQLWFDLLTETRGVPANVDGKGRGNQVIASVVAEGLRNGVILRGKDMSVTQKLAIADASGDPEAWIKVMNDGAWWNVDIRTRTGEAGVTEYYLDYVLIYAKGDWVRKITGSHNLV